MKNRKFDRVGFQAEAVVTHNNVSFKGEVEDLSLKGLFLRTAHPVTISDEVSVFLRFLGATDQFSFTIPAIVVRATESGMGLSFRRIDIDTLFHEKKIRTSGDPAHAKMNNKYATFLGRDVL